MSTVSIHEQLREELGRLLEEDVASAKHREQTAFDQLAAPFGDALVLFGAGNLGRKTLRGLRRIGIEPLAFSDNDIALWGTTVDGIEVLSPEDAANRHGQRAAFVVTIWRGEGRDTMAERCRPLIELGCTRVLNFGLLFWKYPQIFLPHYSLDLPHKLLEQAEDVVRAFDLWADDASRNEYVTQIRWRLHLDFDALPRPVQHEIYFPADLVELSDAEVFVDCGAFDGDTIASFLRRSGGRFEKIFAFEADPGNYGRLGQYILTLPPELRSRITTYPFAVAEHGGKVRFSATGTEASFVGHGNLEVDCSSLDALLADSDVTWIKMDIEGSEPNGVAGARTLITERSPLLAVCVYHRQDHLWRVPLMVRALSDEYRYFLRPHLLESWDLLCYAIPALRLRSAVQLPQ